MNQEKLSQLFNNFVTKNNLPKACISLQDAVSGQEIELNHGDMKTDTPFVLASVTKLWVTTLILQLIDQGKLSYDNIVSDFIEKEKVFQLHHFLGEDQSKHLTVRNLLFQRTGLPNVFYEEPVALRRRIRNEDFSYQFSEMIEWVKSIEAHFAPGSKEAYYADINFTLLGAIVESIHHQTLDDCIDKYIMRPLGLYHSYLANTEFDFIPPLFIGEGYIKRPKVISSGQGAGGGISTSADLMIFIKAFFEGDLFDKSHFEELQDYLPLQGDYAPVEYGGGHMKLALGKFEEKDRLSFYGHSGISGAFAFYCPELKVYLTGTTDNAKKSELCIQLLYLLLFELEKEAQMA